MQEQPTAEHLWLQQLVGEWTYEAECSMGPDQPSSQMKGTESVRSLGGLWTIGEWTMDTGECPGRSIMTLGYDPCTRRFIGTFINSMLTHLWPYQGSLDERRVLTLDSDGPSFSGDGTMANYQDVIEFLADDHRTLTARVLTPEGKWQPFMVTHFHRVASSR